MTSFSFATVPVILSAPGATRDLGKELRARFPNLRRVLLVTDQGFLRTGLAEAPIANLRSAMFHVEQFADVVADPPEHVIEQALALARQNETELVIGLGGGSSMDVAKLVAVLADSPQSLAEIYGIGNVRGTRLPLVQIPTTAGTGSEVTNISIVTTGATSKMGIVAPQLFADMAILDAELTIGLPSAVTAATGIDAMVHAIEAYTSKHKKNPLSDGLARQALSLLSRHLIRACENGHDLAARQAMLLGAMLAGQAFANAPVAAVHALAYPIGGVFHVPHGLSNSLVLPHVLRFNAEACAEQYAELATIIVPHTEGSPAARAEALAVAMQQFAIITGLPRTLQQVGITASDLDLLADEAMKQTRLLGNNPRPVTRDDAHALYKLAL
ncbi:iron-containing alcohol dehydrogenase [Pseudoduganella sp. R-34]|uniref:iron-containing alcohol dehydrogenase n=1 Tax=Pseudoduganella sp. R-34 TaxID=3404062 RepID=UPI003CEF298E